MSNFSSIECEDIAACTITQYGMVTKVIETDFILMNYQSFLSTCENGTYLGLESMKNKSSLLIR